MDIFALFTFSCVFVVWIDAALAIWNEKESMQHFSISFISSNMNFDPEEQVLIDKTTADGCDEPGEFSDRTSRNVLREFVRIKWRQPTT